MGECLVNGNVCYCGKGLETVLERYYVLTVMLDARIKLDMHLEITEEALSG